MRPAWRQLARRGDGVASQRAVVQRVVAVAARRSDGTVAARRRERTLWPISTALQERRRRGPSRQSRDRRAQPEQATDRAGQWGRREGGVAEGVAQRGWEVGERWGGRERETRRLEREGGGTGGGRDVLVGLQGVQGGQGGGGGRVRGEEGKGGAGERSGEQWGRRGEGEGGGRSGRVTGQTARSSSEARGVRRGGRRRGGGGRKESEGGGAGARSQEERQPGQRGGRKGGGGGGSGGRGWSWRSPKAEGGRGERGGESGGGKEGGRDEEDGGGQAGGSGEGREDCRLAPCGRPRCSRRRRVVGEGRESRTSPEAGGLGRGRRWGSWGWGRGWSASEGVPRRSGRAELEGRRGGSILPDISPTIAICGPCLPSPWGSGRALRGSARDLRDHLADSPAGARQVGASRAQGWCGARRSGESRRWRGGRGRRGARS